MDKLLDYVIKSIVTKPDEVEITLQEEGSFPVYMIKVHPDDLGIVIGKGGSNIRAIRTLARLRGFNTGEKARIELYEPDRVRENNSDLSSKEAPEITSDQDDD